MTGERFSVDPAVKAFIHDLRLSPATVLRRARLPEGMFGSAPVALTPAEYYRLWSALEAEAGDRNLAVEVGKALSVEIFSPPILAALCSPDLALAARRIAEFKPLIGPLRIGVASDAAGLTVTCHWPDGPRPPDVLTMSELVFWVALARIGTRRHIRPTGVVVPVPPIDRHELEHYFGAPVIAGNTYAVRFSRADADRVFLTENEQMWRFFAPELRRRLSDLEASASVTDRVRAALTEMLPAGDSSMTTVTNRLAVSQRTLQRQLRDEGTTYKDVLADTRRTLATHYLDRADLSPAEIAYLLGYDDTNSFYRAFRTWTGTTPRTMRTSVGTADVVAGGDPP
ncbi:AraC family transcriptional regulator [Nocardia bovistercoris]|uniref:AraC family transcriptional regulator ligand-binding domain-containing protein n=1 Tax=Nocardia bovistercoris TaxID=2785916 RepID=A0A931I841_9NOCA|nr:AraC family transcriptional regulator [Nocardia bovistercoris]MBH0776609.1 AraC family transcriptional regulator ligand-binding domain-containing protein [Nocardia bovistercoris]